MHSHHHLTLKNLKLKVTPKRLAILDILTREQIYLSPEEIWERMKRRFKRIGLPTIYRNLEELSEGLVISQVILPDRQLRYFFCANQNHHHHFICLSCRRVEDVNFCGVKELEKEVRRIQGMILSHILQVNGLCRKCSSEKRDRHEI